ncbi:MAG: hypothetical protein DMD83_07330 [Candidatus Rokuibacteriota bacterium]|nr:MAG: hypothetical protein DMD83_07330 [Candidatus Rokubacteria bacterium]
MRSRRNGCSGARSSRAGGSGGSSGRPLACPRAWRWLAICWTRRCRRRSRPERAPCSTLRSSASAHVRSGPGAAACCRATSPPWSSSPPTACSRNDVRVAAGGERRGARPSKGRGGATARRLSEQTSQSGRLSEKGSCDVRDAVRAPASGKGTTPPSAFAGMLTGPVLLLAAVTVAVAVDGAGTPSALRHLYLVPTVWAALAAGARGGGLLGLIAGLLQAPFTLPAMERLGLGAQSVDGLVSMATPLAFGWVVGGLVDQSRARARRLQAVLDLQRSLSRDIPLQQRLDLAAEQVAAALGAKRVGLVVGGAGDTRVIASAPAGCRFDEQSAVGWTLREGHPVSAEDLHRDARFTSEQIAGPTPVRGLVLPLDSGSGLLGALAVERAGGLPSATRAAAREMALHLALAIENARLALRQRRLRELDQAKSEFVSVVAHELRTPLTALQGFTELLLSRAVPPEHAARFLSHLHGEAKRLGRIVAELLDLSRIESGRPLELRREPLDVAELLERNVELFAAQHRRHRFEWTPDPGAPMLHADQDAVDRILKNLTASSRT